MADNKKCPEVNNICELIGRFQNKAKQKVNLTCTESDMPNKTGTSSKESHNMETILEDRGRPYLSNFNT